MLYSSLDWFKEKNQESHIFGGKNHGFRFRFSLRQCHQEAMRHLVEGIEALEVRKASHHGRRLVKIEIGRKPCVHERKWVLHILLMFTCI